MVSAKAIQSEAGTQPYKTVVVLKYGLYFPVRESVFHPIVADAGLVMLGSQPACAPPSMRMISMELRNFKAGTSCWIERDL